MSAEKPHGGSGSTKKPETARDRLIDAEVLLCVALATLVLSLATYFHKKTIDQDQLFIRVIKILVMASLAAAAVAASRKAAPNPICVQPVSGFIRPHESSERLQRTVSTKVGAVRARRQSARSAVCELVNHVDRRGGLPQRPDTPAPGFPPGASQTPRRASRSGLRRVGRAGRFSPPLERTRRIWYELDGF